MSPYFRYALFLCVGAGVVVTSACSTSSTTETKSTKSTEQPPAYYKVDPATAGTVSGKVSYTGRAARTKVDMEEDPQCAKLHKTAVYNNTIEVGSKGALVNAFVYIKTGLEGKKFEAPSNPVVIDQHGCWFVPRVIGAQAGQKLNATNSDPVTHNIHPLAKINREWNQNQPEGAPPAIATMKLPEIMIRVKCNIHPWMKAWIGVVDNPYFAVTGEDGKFEFKNVPPGTYTVETWQEDLGTQDQQVTLAASGTASADFTFKEGTRQ